MDHTDTHSTINISPLSIEVEGKSDLKVYAKISLDLLLTIAVYFIFYFLKKKSFIYDDNYFLFIPVLIAAWALGGFLSGKFRLRKDHIFLVRIKRHYTALLVSLGAVAVFLLQTDYSISRFVVAGTFISAFLTALIIEFYLTGGKIIKPDLERGPVSYQFFALDFLLLSWILFILYEKSCSF